MEAKLTEVRDMNKLALSLDLAKDYERLSV